MESHAKVIEQMKALRGESSLLLEGGQVDEALIKVDEALALEESNQKSLSLKADILEKMGDSKDAETLRERVKLSRLVDQFKSTFRHPGIDINDRGIS